MKRSKQRIKKSRGLVAWLRAGGVVAAALVVVTGVTYATLQSQQIKLTGNVISTTTANLQISSDGTKYTAAQSGFAFTNIVPGGQAMPYNGYPFYLKNNGGTPLSLRFSVTSTPSNPDGVDLSKVNILLTPIGGGSPQSIPLSMLVGTNSTGGVTISAPTQLMPGLSAQYTLQVSMEPDAISGTGASLGNIDFAFSGIAQNN